MIDCGQSSKRVIDENLHKHKHEFESIEQKHGEAKRIRLAATNGMRQEAENEIGSQAMAVTANLTMQGNLYNTLEELVSTIRRRHVLYIQYM